MTEHVCCRSTCLPQKVLRISGLYGIGTNGLSLNLGHNGNYHTWRPPGGTFQGKDHQQVVSPSAITSPRESVNGESSDVAIRTRLAKEICIPGRSQTRGRKEKPYKRRRSTPKPGLKFNILKVTICEQKACNVNVNVSIYLLIVECNFSFFHKTFSS